MSGALLSMVAAAMFAAQATPTLPTVAEKNTITTLTLTGCLDRDAARPGSDAFSDATSRLSGLARRKDDGQRGEMVVGTGSRRVVVRGGLVPSPNVAAQAGALDPVAPPSQAGRGHPPGTRSDPLPEFRVERGQAISRWCS